MVLVALDQLDGGGALELENLHIVIAMAQETDEVPDIRDLGGN